MYQVVLQPASNSNARQHYADTIERTVPLDKITPHVSPERAAAIEEHYEDGAPVWGVTPGQNGGNAKKWARIEPGAVGLFSRDRHIYASATITQRFRSKDLAIDLWGRHPNGDTWEYIYLMDLPILDHRVPYEDFNEVAGYASNNNIQSFEVLYSGKSQNILAYFDFANASTFDPETQGEEFKKAVDKLGELEESEGERPLSRRVETYRRLEQRYLRSYLFDSRDTAECCICGREYPTNLLVASHIKKRSKCTKSEKLDYKHVVAPMCQLGCDELFERKYIYVDADGLVKGNEVEQQTSALRSYVDELEGNRCPHWSEGSQPYFAWHRNR